MSLFSRIIFTAMEQWITHADCETRHATSIVKMWIPICNILQQFPHDTIFIDATRIDLLFDNKGEIIKERWDSNSNFWGPENPLPINSIPTDEILLEAIKIYQPDLVDRFEWLAKIRDKYPQNCALIVVQDVQDKLPVFYCYMTQVMEEEDEFHNKIPNKTHIILAPTPNSQFTHYCRSCGEIAPTKRCPGCKPTDEFGNLSSKSFTKPGTYYCNDVCQHADWSRHKNECLGTL